MRSLRTTIVAAAAAALCACSGGGGGGSTGGDTGGTTGGLTVSPTQLTFVYVIGGSAPSQQLIFVNWTTNDARYVGAAYLKGGSKPGWLGMSTTQSSTSSHYQSLTVSVNTAGLTAGSQSTTFQVGIARADGSTIASRDVTVTLVVKAFGAETTEISRTAVYGSSVAPDVASFPVRGSGTTWTATVDPADWLTVTPGSGNTSGGYAWVHFDPSGLATGAYQGTVTFTSGQGATDTVPVTLTVVNPTFTITPSRVALDGLGGNDVSPKKVQVSLDTGTNAYPYQVTTSAAWVELAEVVTTACATPGVFTATPSVAAREWASADATTARITVTADVDGGAGVAHVSRTVVVASSPDRLKLLVDQDGVALARAGTLERLTRSVEVRTNREVAATWTAVADGSPSWLSVTSSGGTGTPLVLAADPAGLGTGLYEATVTVHSSDARLAHATETVRVGLWVGGVTPDAVTTVSGSFREVATDPVRPYAYVADGTAALKIYNVHTGAQIGTLAGPTGTRLGGLAVSSDGARLWALDGLVPSRIVPFDLTTRTAGTPWAVPPPAYNGSTLAYARTNGVGLLVGSWGAIYDAETAVTVATYATPDSWSAVVASRDGRRFCAIALGYSPTDLSCWPLANNTHLTPSIIVGAEQAMPWNTISSGDDLALSPDGATLYVAAGGVAVFDASLPSGLPRVGTIAAGSGVRAVDVGPDGRIYAGGGSYGVASSAWAFGADGSPLASYGLAYVPERMTRVSGDGLRLVVGTGDTIPPATSLKLVTLPAP